MSNQNQQTNSTTVGKAQQSQVACQNSSQFNNCEGIIAHTINIEHLTLTSEQSEAINSAEQNQTTIERIQNATLSCNNWLNKKKDLVMSQLQLDITKFQLTSEQLFERIEHDTTVKWGDTYFVVRNWPKINSTFEIIWKKNYE